MNILNPDEKIIVNQLLKSILGENIDHCQSIIYCKESRVKCIAILVIHPNIKNCKKIHQLGNTTFELTFYHSFSQIIANISTYRTAKYWKDFFIEANVLYDNNIYYDFLSKLHSTSFFYATDKKLITNEEITNPIVAVDLKNANDELKAIVRHYLTYEKIKDEYRYNPHFIFNNWHYHYSKNENTYNNIQPYLENKIDFDNLSNAQCGNIKDTDKVLISLFISRACGFKAFFTDYFLPLDNELKLYHNEITVYAERVFGQTLKKKGFRLVIQCTIDNLAKIKTIILSHVFLQYNPSLQNDIDLSVSDLSEKDLQYNKAKKDLFNYLLTEKKVQTYHTDQLYMSNIFQELIATILKFSMNLFSDKNAFNNFWIFFFDYMRSVDTYSLTSIVDYKNILQENTSDYETLFLQHLAPLQQVHKNYTTHQMLESTIINVIDHIKTYFFNNENDKILSYQVKDTDKLQISQTPTKNHLALAFFNSIFDSYFLTYYHRAYICYLMKKIDTWNI